MTLRKLGVNFRRFTVLNHAIKTMGWILNDRVEDEHSSAQAGVYAAVAI